MPIELKDMYNDGWRAGEGVSVETLKGAVFKEIYKDDNFIMFKTDKGLIYQMYHAQDCCENVYIEDVCGDMEDLLDSEILHFEERTDSKGYVNDWESVTYTFYDIQTRKGCVNLRWCGSSNGYYSEAVDFVLRDLSKN